MSEKHFTNSRKDSGMSYQFNHFEITDQTEIVIEDGALTIDEKDWLTKNGVLQITGFNTEDGEANTVKLDVQKLAQIAYEHDLLKSVASSVETDVLDVFRESDETTLTTAEIAEKAERPKSSVSRALSRLSEKEKLIKVQPGVYRKR